MVQRGSYLVKLCLNLHHVRLHIVNTSPGETTQSQTVYDTAKQKQLQ